MAAPIIKDPTSKVPTIIVSVFVLLAVAAIFISAAMQDNNGAEEVAEIDVHYPQDFFSFPQQEVEPEEPEELPELPPIPAPPPVPDPPEVIVAKPEPKPLPPSDMLFKQVTISNEALQINAARRGSVKAIHRMRTGEINSSGTRGIPDGTWNEAQTEASLPRDLSRVIAVDKMIPAVLVNSIRSELGGKVIAKIETNIYGGSGRLVLIPAGSSAVGYYQPLKKAGDTRIAIIWSRIITPDGINIHTGNAELADEMGRAGITGDVDNRYWEKYGMALLVSTLQAATAYALPVDSRNQQVVIQNYGSGISTMSEKILDQNISLKPIVTAPAGKRITINPMKDIYFPTVEKGSIEAIAYGG